MKNLFVFLLIGILVVFILNFKAQSQNKMERIPRYRTEPHIFERYSVELSGGSREDVYLKNSANEYVHAFPGSILIQNFSLGFLPQYAYHVLDDATATIIRPVTTTINTRTLKCPKGYCWAGEYTFYFYPKYED